mmetsp:Transcript_14522/g.29706  ORF Transcript_14522/g.29706 Transcript_14522/m.29706 type:complete len:598 (-) Transcript_14522:65-1858(-)
MSVSNKRSAEEISLLQGITSTLETNLRGVAPNQNFTSDIDYEDYNDIPLPALPTLKSKSQQSRTIAAPMQSSQQAKSAVDISQTAVKNFLAEKTLIKSITKACVAERVAVGDDSIIEELVTKYKTDYSGLTVKKVVDSITRVTSGNVESGEVSGEKDSNDVATANVETKAAPEEKEEKEVSGEEEAPANTESEAAPVEKEDSDKVGRCIALIDEEMKQYYVKIAELKAKRRKVEAKIAAKAKRKREQAAAAAAFVAAKEAAAKEGGSATTTDDAPKKPAKRKRTTKNFQPKSNFKFVDPDDALYTEMTERYYKIKEANEHLPSRTLEKIIAETKRDMHRDDFNVPYRNVYNEIKRRWKMRSDVGATAEGEKIKKIKEMYDELYKRYCEMKSSQKKLSTGAFAELGKSVKLEFGFPDDFAISKNRITYRYRREFPDRKSNPDHVVEIRSLSSEDKKRREHLVNEVVARYLKVKDANPKKLANGTISRIIEETKKDLDIHEFDVPESSIRGRIHRKSYYVSHENGNRDDIDDPLVETINSWLKNGISVTREQGLTLANQMLSGKNLDKDSDGNTITLDAVWWKCFLNRCHHKLNGNALG